MNRDIYILLQELSVLGSRELVKANVMLNMSYDALSAGALYTAVSLLYA